MTYTRTHCNNIFLQYTITVLPDFRGGSGKMEYVLNYNVVTLCNTLSKIIQAFPPYFIKKTHHIIRYKHTTRTTSSIVEPTS